MAKPKMSAEEAAVRKALAAVQADTGIAKAQEILRTGVVPTPTATSSKISDIDTSTALGKEAAKRLGQAQSYVDKTEPIIAQKYDDLGYVYNPNTGQATPKVNTGGDNANLNKNAGVNKDAVVDKDTRDAFALLQNIFNSYGLSELAAEIEGYMKEGLGTGQATLKLKQSKAYKDRFKGNELRLASGFNIINEAEYLDLENSYSQTLKAYGIQDYFGVGATAAQRLTRQQAMAEVIGKDISAVEFKDRVSTSVDRVKNADPGTKKAFQDFYGVGETELVKYFLDPVKSLVSLKEKATAAEIGGAAIGQNLPATMTSAEDLARFGINREQAQIGYGRIAEELPTASKLGNIYSESGTIYGQIDAEQATFKELASAKRKKERLKQLEESSFKGSAGVGDAGLSTQYLRRGSSAGQF